jgi:hypothetical protein
MRTLFSSGILLLVAACTGGNGPATQLPNVAREPGGSGQEPAPGTREDPGGTREDPGGTREDPGGGQTGGAPGGGGTCPRCDYVYKCTFTVGGQTDTSSVTLETSGGQCVIPNGANQPDAVFSCGGTVTQGTTVVHWTPTADGGFSYSVASSSGQIDATCEPDHPLGAVAPGGGSGSVPTADAG